MTVFRAQYTPIDPELNRHVPRAGIGGNIKSRDDAVGEARRKQTKIINFLTTTLLHSPDWQHFSVHTSFFGLPLARPRPLARFLPRPRARVLPRPRVALDPACPPDFVLSGEEDSGDVDATELTTAEENHSAHLERSLPQTSGGMLSVPCSNDGNHSIS
jgi:hypothetical protein